MEEQNLITADMSIGDVIGAHPDTIGIFLRHGLGCVGCAVARFENIAQGAQAHGIDVDLLIRDLNEAIQPTQQG